jgi:hypothetical protein
MEFNSGLKRLIGSSVEMCTHRQCCERTGNGDMLQKTFRESKEYGRIVYLRELISVYKKS